MNSDKNLNELRKQIDKIDKDIFSLLEQRLNIVKKVGDLKNSTAPETGIIRPGREANMVKSIYSNALEKGFSEKIALAFAVLWRNIISLSVNLEERTEILLCSDNPEVKRLSREYFGVFSDIKEESSYSKAISSLASGESSIAVFEIEKSPKEKPWWLYLKDSGQELSIFAGLPFFEKGELSTVTVAKISPEPSGKDKYVYVLDESVSEVKQISSYQGKLLILSEKELPDHNPLGCFAVFR